VRPAWSALLLLPLLSLECAGGGAHHTFVNSGSLCLRPTDDQLHAEVKLLGCLSSSCNRLVANACAIHQEEGQISISSRLVIESNGGDCASDCGSWISRCNLPAPGAGTYGVVFGDASYSLSFPLEMDTELVADGTTRGCTPEESELGGAARM
jgi:hypothetical protein